MYLKAHLELLPVTFSTGIGELDNRVFLEHKLFWLEDTAVLEVNLHLLAVVSDEEGSLQMSVDSLRLTTRKTHFGLLPVIIVVTVFTLALGSAGSSGT